MFIYVSVLGCGRDLALDKESAAEELVVAEGGQREVDVVVRSHDAVGPVGASRERRTSLDVTS